MEKTKMHFSIISQGSVLDTVDVESLTAPTVEGEITVLPGHIPLFSRLQAGELRYKDNNLDESFVVSAGFIDVGPDNTITVIVDSVVAAREISVQKAEKAVADAQQTMEHSQNQQELIMAEASLRMALIEIKLAQKTKRANN